MNVKDLIKNFNGTTSIKEIQKLLADVEENLDEAKTKEEDTGVEDDENSVSELKDKLNLASMGLDQLSEYLNKIQKEIDKVNLPILKSVIDSGITNYTTAYDCTIFYNKGWFSRSFMSIDGKVEFANYLISKIKPFCQSNLETFQMISDRDPSMTIYIGFPRQDD